MFGAIRVLLILMILSIFRVGQLQGNSMQPTVQNENKVLYFVNDPKIPILRIRLLKVFLLKETEIKLRSPKRGSIVLVKATVGGEQKNICKRVVGLPGDEISIINRKLFINGKEIKHYKVKKNSLECYIEVLDDCEFYVTSPFIYTEDKRFIVPEEHIFVLGDNRKDSIDSLSSSVQSITLDDIIGFVVLIW